MTTAGTNITKADTAPGILAQFQSQITDFVNAQSKWASDGTNPFYYNYPLGGYYVASDSWGGYVPLKAGQTVSTAPDAGSLPSADIVASQVDLALRNAAVALSNARQMHLQKYYYDPAFALILWADFGVVLGHLTDNFQMATPGSGLSAGTDVVASTVDTFVNTLDATLTAHRNSTVTFQEYWCHAACHSSHSSRNRR